MDRRQFIKLSSLATASFAVSHLPSAFPARPSFKLSVMLGIVFGPYKIPILEQIKKVKEADYPAFEFINWQDQDLDAVRKRKEELGLEISSIVLAKRDKTRPSLTNPQDRPAFLEALKESIDAARKVGTNALIVLTGNEVPSLSREQQHDSIVEGLRAARQIVEPAKITLLLEPLNTYVDHKGYYLYSSKEAFDIIQKVNSPYVKVLFDMYHIQIMEGNIIATLKANIDKIAHFHVADVPGRHEPGTGEVNWANVLKAIHETGFKGYVAMEFRPTIDPVESLRNVKKQMYDMLTS